MANMVIPNGGKLLALDRWIDPAGTGGENWIIRLYSNNYTPVDGSTLGDFTEATFTGYAAVTLVAGTFPASSIVSNEAVTTYPTAPTFTCTGGGGQTVYGWYAEGATTGTVLAAQKFDASRALVSGASEKIDPFPIKFKSFA